MKPTVFCSGTMLFPESDRAAVLKTLLDGDWMIEESGEYYWLQAEDGRISDFNGAYDPVTGVLSFDGEYHRYFMGVFRQLADKAEGGASLAWSRSKNQVVGAINGEVEFSSGLAHLKGLDDLAGDYFELDSDAFVSKHIGLPKHAPSFGSILDYEKMLFRKASAAMKHRTE